jgi:hypothetical protein
MGARNLRVVTKAVEIEANDNELHHVLEGLEQDLRLATQQHRHASRALAVAIAFSVLSIAGAAVCVCSGGMQGDVAALASSSPPEKTPDAAAPAAQTPAEERSAASAAPDPAVAVHDAFRLLWASRPKLALLRARAALHQEPDDVDALVAQGFALFELRRDKEALASVRRALTLAPRHPLGNLLRGTLAQAHHDTQGAIVHYERYLQRRPSGVVAAQVSAARTTLAEGAHKR